MTLHCDSHLIKLTGIQRQLSMFQKEEDFYELVETNFLNQLGEMPVYHLGMHLPSHLLHTCLHDVLPSQPKALSAEIHKNKNVASSCMDCHGEEKAEKFIIFVLILCSHTFAAINICRQKHISNFASSSL
jgi:hypothetical protein